VQRRRTDVLFVDGPTDPVRDAVDGGAHPLVLALAVDKSRLVERCFRKEAKVTSREILRVRAAGDGDVGRVLDVVVSRAQRGQQVVVSPDATPALLLFSASVDVRSTM
jgi:hypothetical protein